MGTLFFKSKYQKELVLFEYQVTILNTLSLFIQVHTYIFDFYKKNALGRKKKNYESMFINTYI